MKKILVNAYLAKNFGDDLFLKILFDRYKNVNWILYDYTIKNGSQQYKKVFKNYKNVILKQDIANKYSIVGKIKGKLGIKKDISKLINQCDAGIYIGGSIFMQLPQWESQYEERENLINRFYEEGKPYFILGSNFGPYNNIEFIQKYKTLFNKCKDICFRDEYSYSLFSELENVRVNPDIVFQLKYKHNIKIKNTLGISLIDLNSISSLCKYREIYISKIKELVLYSINIEKSVTFFSFCNHLGDNKIINEIIDELDEEYKKQIRVVTYCGDIDEFLKEFSSMENIVATRFHACILSQVFGQGLYPIIYSDKTYNVLKDIELDKYYCYVKDIDKLDVENVLDVINSNKMTNKDVLKESEYQFLKLDDLLNKGK